MSADQFKVAAQIIHPELRDQRVSPIVAARSAKAEATAAHFQRAEEHTNKANVVTLVDYPDDQSGYPAAPTKYSFKKLLNSLSAKDYQERLQHDPAFAKAVNLIDNYGNK